MYKGSYSEKTRKQMITILKENDKFDNLHDSIINFFEDFCDLPENEQEIIYEKLLMALPDNVLGDMYSWGMSDTCVRDNVYTFIEDNKEEFSILTGLVWLIVIHQYNLNFKGAYYVNIKREINPT